MITIATDGSCIGNPGPGAYGFVAQTEQGLFPKAIPVAATTVGEMEVRAFLEAMLYYIANHMEQDTAHILCDSQYVVNGYNEWMAGWQAKGWRKGKGQLAHVDLWKRIADAKATVRHNVTVEWVRAHQNTGSLNDKVDALVNHSARTQEAFNGPSLQQGGDQIPPIILSDMLDAKAPTPAAGPDAAQSEALDIHPLPWTVDPIDAGDVTKFEINDANNFVVCLIDDEPVAHFIVDRANSAGT